MKKLWICLIAGCMVLPLRADEGKPFKAWVEYDTVGWIGDALNLRLYWECDNPHTVQFPVLQDQMGGGLQIIPQDSLQVEYMESLHRARLSYQFTAYTEGTYTIPSFFFEYLKGAKLYRATTDSGRVKLFAPVVDTTSDIKDIRGVFKVSKKELRKEYWSKFGFILWIVLALAAAAAGVRFLLQYLKKRKEGMPLFVPRKPAVPPVDRALAALVQLKEKELWQKGMVKEYHTELTDILRLYLEEEMHIAAVEMTNEELCEAIRGREDVDEHFRTRLTETLSVATLVKFAKSRPSPTQHEDSFAYIKQFLEDRKTKEKANEETTRNQTR